MINVTNDRNNIFWYLDIAFRDLYLILLRDVEVEEDD